MTWVRASITSISVNAKFANVMISDALQSVAARDFDRQVAEIQIRAAILNDFTALVIVSTVAVELTRLG
tara:strand:+ start:431 stop:637 length:207 start_codon:yes stop_codon:yes gene_type:complete